VAPLPNVANVLKVRIHWLIGTDANALNILHWRYSGTSPDDSTAILIAQDIYAAAAANLAPLVESGNKLIAVDVTDLTSPTSGQGQHVANTSGSRGSGFISAGTALLQSLTIQRRYRGGKPRTYWPFGTSGDLVSSSAWTSTFITDCGTGVQAFVNAVNAVTEAGTTLVGQVSVSYYQGFTSVLNPVTGRTRDVPKVRTGSIPVDGIGTWTFDIKPASQRRRNLQRT
jgi:hypothetical protein